MREIIIRACKALLQVWLIGVGASCRREYIWLDNRLRIGAQYLHGKGFLLEGRQYGGDIGIITVSIHVDIKHVFPHRLSRRAGLDTRHADSMFVATGGTRYASC